MDFIRFLIGVSVGSFINVLVMRYRPGKPLISGDVLFGRSHCPHCGKNLRWFELVPIISFLVQRGRCRTCDAKLTFQYITVEVISGLIFLFVPLVLKGVALPLWFFSSIWIAVFSLFIILALIDLREYIIPDEAVIALGGLAILMTGGYLFFDKISVTPSLMGYYAALFGFRENILSNRALGMLFGFAFFGLIVFFSRGKVMGMGDVKLMAVLGLLFGWPEIIMITMLAFILGSIACLPLLLSRKKTMKDMVPFGPFIALSGIIVFFFGFRIIHWYFKIFGIA